MLLPVARKRLPQAGQRVPPELSCVRCNSGGRSRSIGSTSDGGLGPGCRTRCRGAACCCCGCGRCPAERREVVGVGCVLLQGEGQRCKLLVNQQVEGVQRSTSSSTATSCLQAGAVGSVLLRACSCLLLCPGCSVMR